MCWNIALSLLHTYAHRWGAKVIWRSSVSGVVSGPRYWLFHHLPERVLTLCLVMASTETVFSYWLNKIKSPGKLMNIYETVSFGTKVFACVARWKAKYSILFECYAKWSLAVLIVQWSIHMCMAFLPLEGSSREIRTGKVEWKAEWRSCELICFCLLFFFLELYKLPFFFTTSF